MHFLLIAVLLFVAVPHGSAQFATPEALVEEIFDAMNAQDARRSVRTMHPEALTELKRFFVEVEAMFPDEVLYDLPEGQSFSVMSPEEIYEWLLVTSVYDDEISMRVTYDFLGSEKDGDLLYVRVMTHVAIEDFKLSNEETITMQHYEGGWLALSSGDIESYIEMMRTFLVDGQ